MYNTLKTKKARIAHIKEMVAANGRWAVRALTHIYEYQTADEQESGFTRNLNGVGFSGADSEILSSFAEQVLKGRALSEKQMRIVFKKMPKYARQLMVIAEAG